MCCCPAVSWNGSVGSSRSGSVCYAFSCRRALVVLSTACSMLSNTLTVAVANSGTPTGQLVASVAQCDPCNCLLHAALKLHMPMDGMKRRLASVTNFKCYQLPKKSNFERYIFWQQMLGWRGRPSAARLSIRATPTQCTPAWQQQITGWTTNCKPRGSAGHAYASDNESLTTSFR